MTKVKINNANELRTIAAKYGVKVPTAAGRPPKLKLLTELKARGITIEPTEYFPGKTRPRVVNVQTSREVVTKNGTTQRMPAKVRISMAELRQLADRQGYRGRIPVASVTKALRSRMDDPSVVVHRIAEWS